MKDIEQGIVKTFSPYEVVENGKEAIFTALEKAQLGDIVAIAGKGHETYQMFADKTVHFNDAEVVREHFQGA